MKKILVQIPHKTYPVFVGGGATNYLRRILKNSKSKVFIVSDKKLKGVRSKIKSTLKKSKKDFKEFEVKAGESFKDFKEIYSIYGKLIEAGANRDSILIAVGGGSIGDGVGFIAATFLRGVRWIGIPTTLLAQVDSSVGGKTGINHAKGKNLIGAFHQPLAVLCDTDFLKTLSKREMISGLGEALKYGFVFDQKFFKKMEENWSKALKHESKVLRDIVSASIKFKAKAVSRDEFDIRGVREVLNFGHTFGHAIEAETKFKKYQHGEAVLWGMHFALILSVLRKKMNFEDFERGNTFFKKITLPSLPNNSTNIFRAMTKDKKVRDGKINFVLLKKIGKACSDNGVTTKDLHQAMTLLKEFKQ